MLNRDPTQRISARKALLHPWFKKETINNTALVDSSDNESSEIMNEDSSPLENMKKFNHM
jgi:serine/threonine protein kinase